MTAKVTILIADDERDSLNFISAVLVAQGYNVRSATNGPHVLASVRSQPPALIVMAVGLPVVDGFDVCRRLKRFEISRHIPLLFISYRTDLEEQKRGFRLGAADFIGKPLQQAEIIARVRTQLEQPLAANPAAALAEGSRPGAGSILVVEDEDTLRLSVSRALRKGGFSVLEAGDGNLAVDLIRAKAGDIAVVLLDLNLPGKSSDEVLGELRRARPGVKVILTSAYARESLDASIGGLGDESFIRKPYHLSELVGAVRDALAKDS